jgi:hypothetical protein
MTTTHLNSRPAPQPRVHTGGHVTGRASLVFIGEQNGIDAYGNLVGDDPLAQAQQALRNVELAVQAAGGSLADIVKWTITVTDLAARPDLDPGRGHSLGLAVEGEAEHVLERHEPIASFGQEGADRGVGEVAELDLHGGAAGGEGALDLVERGGARHTAEAEPRDLVERRALLGEARHPAGNRDPAARRICPATAGGLAGLGDELRLDALDALGQGSVAEEG